MAQLAAASRDDTLEQQLDGSMRATASRDDSGEKQLDSSMGTTKEPVGGAAEKPSEPSGTRMKVTLPAAPLFVARSPGGGPSRAWVQQYRANHPNCTESEALTGEQHSFSSLKSQ